MRPPAQPNRLWRLAESPIFVTLVLVVIIANAVVLDLQTYEGIELEHGETLNLLKDIFLAFFVVELALPTPAPARPRTERITTWTTRQVAETHLRRLEALSRPLHL